MRNLALGVLLFIYLTGLASAHIWSHSPVPKASGQSFNNVEEVILQFENLNCDLKELKDHRSAFLSMYILITKALNNGINQGAFEDPKWLEATVLKFAHDYKRHFINYERKNYDQIPGSWKYAFSTNKKANQKLTVDLILSLNAHIAYDLPIGIVAVLHSKEKLVQHKEDFFKVNSLIDRIIPNMLSELMDLNYLFNPDFEENESSDIKTSLIKEIVHFIRKQAWINGVMLYNDIINFGRIRKKTKKSLDQEATKKAWIIKNMRWAILES